MLTEQEIQLILDSLSEYEELLRSTLRGARLAVEQPEFVLQVMPEMCNASVDTIVQNARIQIGTCQPTIENIIVLKARLLKMKDALLAASMIDSLHETHAGKE